MLCVFDCESVPDTALLREIYGYGGSDLEVCESAFVAQKEATGSEFLPIAFHKIISISALICDDFGRFVKVGNFGDSSKDSNKDSPKDSSESSANQGESNADSANQKDSNADSPKNERDILSEFLRYLNKNNPKLVSFNGRNFDLPAIMIRALKYNLNAESYFECDNAKHNKNKWENYRARYSENFHIDLLDAFSSFGAARGIKLDVVCKMAGIVGKFDMSGDDVYKLYFAGEFRKIDEYCQSDVLNTYWLYLKYQLLQGKIALFEYADLLNIFLEKMPKDRDYSEVFAKAIKGALAELGN